MRILSRYLVARFLGLFAAILFASTLTIIIVEMLLNFDDMLKIEEGLSGILTYLFLRIPSYYLRDLLPVTSFAAAFFTFGLGARWMEITALKTGGVSPHRVVIPVLVTALLLALGTLVLHESLILRATRQWNLRIDGGGDPIAFRQGSFWYHRGRTIYNINEADRATQTLRGVSLYQLDAQGRLLQSVKAERARIGDDQRWYLENAIIRGFDPDRPEAPPLTQRLEETSIHMGYQSDGTFMEADGANLTLPGLAEFISARAAEGRRTHRLETLFHTRLTDPLLVLLFAMLATPLGMRVEQTRSFGGPAVYGVATLGAYFLLRSVGATLSVEGLLPAAMVPWSATALFAAWGTWGVARIPS